jgi:RNA polymerase sigma-70 factor (ECF subfamily)
MSDARRRVLSAYLERRADLVRYFTLRLRSDEAAEDLVQDIYVKAAAIDPRAEIRNAEGYLFKLGSNLMLDRIRGARRAARRDYDWRAAETDEVGSEGLSHEPSADRVLAARQRLASVVALLKELPPLTQEIFRLHKFEGLTHMEVATRLAVSRSTVEKHVMAVLRRLDRGLP